MNLRCSEDSVGCTLWQAAFLNDLILWILSDHLTYLFFLAYSMFDYLVVFNHLQLAWKRVPTDTNSLLTWVLLCRMALIGSTALRIDTPDSDLDVVVYTCTLAACSWKKIARHFMNTNPRFQSFCMVFVIFLMFSHCQCFCVPASQLGSQLGTNLWRHHGLSLDLPPAVPVQYQAQQAAPEPKLRWRKKGALW